MRTKGYYIRQKEDTGDQATASSIEKVEYAKTIFLKNFTELAALVAIGSDFYNYGFTTFEDSKKRVQCLKNIIEKRDGYSFFYNSSGQPISREEELAIAYRFIWFNALHQYGPVEPIDPKLAIPVEFKLASNSKLYKYLAKKAEISTDNKTGIIVIFHFNHMELTQVQSYLTDLENFPGEIILINASKNPQEITKESMKDIKTSKVFISYTHDVDVWEKSGKDPQTQRKRVFDLAERLQSEGVSCVIDQHIATPPEGWPRWMMNQIESADFVLVVATETYNRRFRGKEEPKKGLGGNWEGAVITQQLYESEGKNEKFIPILFDSKDSEYIPLPLRSATHYNVSNSNSYDDLYFYLTHQPPYQPKALGPIRNRPSDPDSTSASLISEPPPASETKTTENLSTTSHSRLPEAQLRSQITHKLTRSEIGALWYDILGTDIDDTMHGRNKTDCVIALLTQSKQRGLLSNLENQINISFPHVFDLQDT